MSDDIFHSWKQNKFVVAESDFLEMGDCNLIVLTDIAYWNEHYEDLKVWCEEHDAEVRGMTVTCNDHALTLFALRWS